MKVTATFSPAKWDEKPYDQISPVSRMTKATVEYAFKGQMEGTAFAEYLMHYESYDDKDPHAAIATYLGMIRFKGSVNGKNGSFVIEDRGTFKSGNAVSVGSVIKGSGTEELRNITGTATSRATSTGSTFELMYEL